MTRCDMCFQEKQALVPILPGVQVSVCKACSYKVDQVRGFLEYHGIRLEYQSELSLDVETPPNPPRAKNRPPKPRRQPAPPETT